MIRADLVTTPEPHYTPGYTGHCPTYTWRTGETYGSLTHKILLDPTVNHSEQLVLSDSTVSDFHCYGPEEGDDQDLGGAAQKKSVISGYEGFIPHMKSQMGQTFTLAAAEALSEFEEKQLKLKEVASLLEKEVAIQSNQWEPSLEDKMAMNTSFKLPLREVKPDYCGIQPPNMMPNQTDSTLTEASHTLEDSEKVKKFIPGYSGHVPYESTKFGERFSKQSTSAISDFFSNYRKRKSTEWAPISITRPDPPLLIQPTEIYPKHLGMLPNYAGHVPGVQFRAGKSFGRDTNDAKRWLKGDFS